MTVKSNGFCLAAHVLEFIAGVVLMVLAVLDHNSVLSAAGGIMAGSSFVQAVLDVAALIQAKTAK